MTEWLQAQLPFLPPSVAAVLVILFKIVLIVAPLMGCVAYLTLAERKVIGYMQVRLGPNRVSLFGLNFTRGLGQPIADALKLMTKEIIIPSGANKFLFLAAPVIALAPALAAWAVVPFGAEMTLANINAGLLYILALTSLGVYGIIIAGWASNSKYAFLGALRSAAQMVSYEVSMGFVIVTVLLCVGSLNLTDIVRAREKIWFAIPLFPMFVIFFISALAETNRSPFDLPEGESEIVAGFFVEYSSMSFGLFFLGEYANMFLISAMTTILFLGGWHGPLNILPVLGPLWFVGKVCLLMFVFVWARATFPRYRYDQLMRLGWKVFLPFSLFWLVLTAGVLMAAGWLPHA